MMHITALIPLKIKNDAQFRRFQACFTSYKFVVEKYKVVLNIADESNGYYSQQIRSFLRKYDVEKNFIKSNGYVDAVQRLIQSVKNDYFFFIVDDVELLRQKDFIKPSIAAFRENGDLIQIKFGGGLSARKSKVENLKMYKDLYRPFQYQADVVWVNKISLDRERYIFSHYNCVLKTEIFQKIDSRISAPIPSFDAYVLFLKENFLGELGEFTTGWLNWEDYLYVWERSPTSKKEALHLLETSGER